MATEEYAGLIIQNPNFFGSVENCEEIQKTPKSLLIAEVEMMSLAALKKPAEYNADIVVGDVQSFGNSLSFFVSNQTSIISGIYLIQSAISSL